jgi:hypothetical protein
MLRLNPPTIRQFTLQELDPSQISQKHIAARISPHINPPTMIFATLALRRLHIGPRVFWPALHRNSDNIQEGQILVL